MRYVILLALIVQSACFVGCSTLSERIERIKNSNPNSEEEASEKAYHAAANAFLARVMREADRYAASPDSAEDISDAALSASTAEAKVCRDAIVHYWDYHASAGQRQDLTDRLYLQVLMAAKMAAKRTVIERRSTNASKPVEIPPTPDPKAMYSA